MTGDEVREGSRSQLIERLAGQVKLAFDFRKSLGTSKDESGSV